MVCCKCTPCADGLHISTWSMNCRNLSPSLLERLIILMCCLLRSLFRHSLHLMTFVSRFSGCTLDRKQCWCCCSPFNPCSFQSGSLVNLEIVEFPDSGINLTVSLWSGLQGKRRDALHHVLSCHSQHRR